MARVAYTSKRFYSEKAALLPHVQSIVEEYAAAGFKLNPRSVAYRMEGRGIIVKTEKTFSQVESIVADGRDIGDIDWDQLSLDLGRATHKVATWNGGEVPLLELAAAYRLDKWAYQPNRVEVITEKTGLHGILDPVADRYDVPVRAVKGYDGKGDIRATALRIMRRNPEGRLLAFVHEWTGIGTLERSALRISTIEALLLDKLGQEHLDEIRQGVDEHTLILFIGDHDPSGLDLERDIRAKLDLYGASGLYTMKRIAITCAETCQADEPELHSAPAKSKDTRLSGYLADGHTDQSWEVESLEPAVLGDRVRDAIVAEMDVDRWNADLGAQESDQGRFRRLASGWETS